MKRKLEVITDKVLLKKDYLVLLMELKDRLDRMTFKDFEILHGEICGRVISINAETRLKIQELFGDRKNLVDRYINIMNGLKNCTETLVGFHNVETSEVTTDASVASTNTQVASTNISSAANSFTQHNISCSTSNKIVVPDIALKKSGKLSSVLYENIRQSPFLNRLPSLNGISKNVSYASHKYSLLSFNAVYENSSYTTANTSEGAVHTPVASNHDAAVSDHIPVGYTFSNAFAFTISDAIPPTQCKVSNQSTSDVYPPDVPGIYIEKRWTSFKALCENSLHTTVNTYEATVHNPVTSSFTPVASSFTPVASSFTPVSSSFTPVTSSFTPVSSSFTSVSSSFTPVASSFTPVASSFTPVASSFTPVASSFGPITSSFPPFPSSFPPFPSPHTPVASSFTPIASAFPTFASSYTPVLSTFKPVASNHTPVASNHAAAVSDHTPVVSAYSKASAYTISDAIPPTQRKVFNLSTSDVYPPDVPDIPFEKRWSCFNVGYENSPYTSPLNILFPPNPMHKIDHYISHENRLPLYNAVHVSSPYTSTDNRWSNSNAVFENSPYSSLPNRWPPFNTMYLNYSHTSQVNQHPYSKELYLNFPNNSPVNKLSINEDSDDFIDVVSI